eukprot:scaffold6062_cov100-Skeletonema_dohrnii-CCMP3373.AAC.2
MKFHLAIVPFLQVAAWNLNGVQTFKRNNAQHLSESFLALENTSIANNVMLWNPLDSGATTLKEKKSQRVITSDTQESMASKNSFGALGSPAASVKSTTNDAGDAGANVTPPTPGNVAVTLNTTDQTDFMKQMQLMMEGNNKLLQDISIRLKKVEDDMSRDSDDPIGTVITTTGTVVTTTGPAPPASMHDTATATAVVKALATSPSDVRTTTVDPTSALGNKSKVPPPPPPKMSGGTSVGASPAPQMSGGTLVGATPSAFRGATVSTRKRIPSPIPPSSSLHYHAAQVQDGGDAWSTATGSHHIEEQFVDPYQRGQTLGLDEEGELWMKGGDPAATVAYGIDHITDSDFTYLGISSKDTSYRAQIRRDHKKLYHGWIGTAMNYKAGPQVSKALESTQRPTLQSESSAGFVKLWDDTSKFLSNYYMAIVPFGVINMSDSYWKIGIPGIGVYKQELIAGELFIYLEGVFRKTTLAGINYAIDIVGRRGGNGFDLLKELGTSVFPVLNMGKVIDAPTFMTCDRNTWRLATEMDIFHRIMQKRGLVPNTKSKAMLYLEQLQPHVPAAAALLSVLETQADESVDVQRWDIMALGRQFSSLTPQSMVVSSHEQVPLLQHQQPSALVNNAQALFLQGYQAQCHFTKQQGRQVKPRDKFDPRRLPDPKRRRLPGYVDGQICEACGKANHTANTCRFLIASIYLKLYRSKYPQQCKELEASIMKRLDTKPPPKRVNLLALVDDYSASTGFSVNKIADEMAWDTFYEQVEYVEESDDEEEQR